VTPYEIGDEVDLPGVRANLILETVELHYRASVCDVAGQAKIVFDEAKLLQCEHGF
jgi:hypothetical protein